jgi:hypothetical protein
MAVERASQLLSASSIAWAAHCHAGSYFKKARIRLKYSLSRLIAPGPNNNNLFAFGVAMVVRVRVENVACD